MFVIFFFFVIGCFLDSSIVLSADEETLIYSGFVVLDNRTDYVANYLYNSSNGVLRFGTFFHYQMWLAGRISHLESSGVFLRLQVLACQSLFHDQKPFLSSLSFFSVLRLMAMERKGSDVSCKIHII